MRKDNEPSDKIVTKDGLRQGGVLSPTLFILIIIYNVIKKAKKKPNKSK